MKIQHLRFFAAVIECGGVVKAAKRLHVSQPAISAALRALEEELGEPLFERPGGGRRLIATSKAMRFHQRALGILSQCEAARAEFRARADKPPRLRIGVLPTIATGDVASVTMALRRHGAKWRLQLWEGDPARLAEWLRQGRIDAAWTSVDREASDTRLLWREPFVAMMSPGHRLARHPRSTISLKELDGEALVLRSSCELKGGRLRGAGISLPIAARADRDDLALRLVAQGVGIAIAPRSLATSEVVAMSVADLGLEREIGVIWRPEMPEPMLTTLLDAFSTIERVTGRA